MLMVALNPALLFDTVVWGQSDSVLALVMWLAVLATLSGEYEISWALTALAVLIKPSRTVQSGSSMTQVMACAVSGRPRLAIFTPSTKTKTSSPSS
jgi:hypothetical protein